MMNKQVIEQQDHGYKNGHQLLASSVTLTSSDQDTIDRLSDMAGSLQPGETFSPYITGYPLPSRKYYILAKTWQDLTASRAGCVLTKSLIIPLEVWTHLKNIAPIFELFQPVEKSNQFLTQLHMPASPTSIPVIENIPGQELVEALFLEERKPTVVFDMPMAEIAAERLINAFWPAMRREFCFCTNAFAPRTIEDRSFDLLFSSRKTRSRFANWSGRKIDATENTPSRHRWTNLLVKHIFETDNPSFKSLDGLGLLYSLENSNEKTLRTSLLWSELLEKSKTSSTAVLGMIDILETNSTLDIGSVKILEPLIIKSIDLSLSSNKPVATWELIRALLEKLSKQRLTTDLINKIKHTAKKLASRDVGLVLNILKEACAAQKKMSSILYTGIAYGIAENFNEIDLGVQLDEIPSESWILLLAHSEDLSREMMLCQETAPIKKWRSFLADSLITSEKLLKIKLQRNILPYLNRADHSSILRAILSTSDIDNTEKIMEKLWQNTEFTIREFDDVFCDVITGDEKKKAIINQIAGFPETENTNRLMSVLLHATQSDIDWLCNSSLPNSRITNLLINVVSKATDHQAKKLASDAGLLPLVVKYLMGNVERSARNLCRLVMLGHMPIRRLLEVSVEISPLLENDLKLDLQTHVVARSFVEASKEANSLLHALLKDLAPNIDPLLLISLATTDQASNKRIGSNLDLIFKASPMIMTELSKKIDIFSEKMTLLDPSVLSSDIILQWSRIVEEASEFDVRKQLRAAVLILDFCFSHKTEKKLAPLLVLSFPIVYLNTAPPKKPSGIFPFIPLVVIDERKNLIHKLVSCYIISKWPTSTILNICIEACVFKEILLDLHIRPGGEIHIESIKENINKMPKEHQKYFQRELEKLHL